MGEGLFTLRSPENLYEKAKRDFAAFHRDQTADNLFNLLCTLNHLREWICPTSHQEYERRSPDSWSPEEHLHHDLWEDPDFQVVRDLCNNAKHFRDKSGIGAESETVHGFFPGLSFPGDSLPYYFARNKELRGVLDDVFAKYESYFRRVGPGVGPKRLKPDPLGGDPQQED